MANKEPDEISESAAWKQLSNAVALGAKQDQIVWTVFGAFFAANGVLLVALVTTGSFTDGPTGLMVGAVLSFIWWLIQRRAIWYLERYESVMCRLEKRLLNDDREIALSRGLNTTGFEDPPKGPSVRWLMKALSALFLIAWLVLVAIYFLQPESSIIVR
jgi:hypothetical protein